MKKSILFSILALGAMLSSCKSPLVYSTRTARTETIPTSTWSTWTTADLKVDENRVSMTVEAPKDKKLFISEEQLKENAIGAILEKYSADVLINPLYKTDYKDGVIESVTVSGYPAKHTNFRNITFEEQTKYLIEKEKAVNAPQIMINGGEIINEVAAPAPAPQPEPQNPKK